MLLTVLGLGTAAVGFISVVHLLGALGLILALLFADFCWAEEPRRWRAAASTEPPQPGKPAAVTRRTASYRHALDAVGR